MATKKTGGDKGSGGAGKKSGGGAGKKSSGGAGKKSSGGGKGGGSKSGSKRTLIEPNEDKRYIRRGDKGRIKESDDVGRSLSQDVKKPAKTKVPAGQGDKGDQKRKK